MPRSPRLAHKAPVMQARIPLHIYKIRCHWFVRAGRDIYNVQIVKSWKVTDWFVTRTQPDKQEMISLSEKERSFKQTNFKNKQRKQNNEQNRFFLDLVIPARTNGEWFTSGSSLWGEVRTPFRQNSTLCVLYQPVHRLSSFLDARTKKSAFRPLSRANAYLVRAPNSQNRKKRLWAG